MENQTVKETQAVQTVQTQTPKKQKSPFDLALGRAKSTFTDIYGEAAERKFKQEAGFAYMLAQKNVKLQACTPDSVRNALIQVALTDITLNPNLNYAYLIPRNVKGPDGQYRTECVLEIDYKYMIDLMIKNGIVEAVDVGVIFKGEKYEYRKGTNPTFDHWPDLELQEDSQEHAIASYMTAYINGHKIPFVLTKKEVMIRKEESKSHNVWNGIHWRGMWIKSAIRYAYKFLPKSPKVDAVMAILNENDSKESVKPETTEIVYE